MGKTRNSDGKQKKKGRVKMKLMKCIRCGCELIGDQIDLCEYCDSEAGWYPPTDEEVLTPDIMRALLKEVIL